MFLFTIGSSRKTTTDLQLADWCRVTLEGIVEDVMVSIYSWEYPIDFLSLQPKTKFNGYPLILGRPWLATVDAYISCRSENMTIKNGPLSKQLVLYPPTQPSIDHDLPIWLENEEDELYNTAPMCTIDVILRGGNLYEDEVIDHAIQNQSSTNNPLKTLVKEFESQPWMEVHSVESTSESTKVIDFGPSLSLKINPNLSNEEEKHLCQLLKENLDAFSWDYKDMKGVHPSV